MADSRLKLTTTKSSADAWRSDPSGGLDRELIFGDSLRGVAFGQDRESAPGFTECAGQLDQIREVVRRSHALLPGVGTMLSSCCQKRRTAWSLDGLSNPASKLRCTTVC